MARLTLILLLAALAAGCGYFEVGEDHVAPQTPLLPPTSEVLEAPATLTPTATAPSPATTTAPPSDADTAEPAPDGGEADDADGSPEENGDPDEATGEPRLLQIVVTGELNHDPTAFTQGLEISDGRLYESTGAPGDRISSIRELDRDTGEVLRRERITEDLYPQRLFAEGITFVDDRMFQLTWKDEVVLVWDREDLSVSEVFEYEGQGWGLCYNGSVLVMSDGSAELHFRNPVTFERVGNPVVVTLEGEELPSLNELECVGDRVWANVWQTDLIVQIDPVTGRVLALADASDLGLPRPDDPNAVLNGIAWDPATETFLITGKDWPAIYELYFEAEGAPNEDPQRLDP